MNELNLSEIELLDLMLSIGAMVTTITGLATAWLRLSIKSSNASLRSDLVDHMDERFQSKAVADERHENHTREIERISGHVFGNNGR